MILRVLGLGVLWVTLFSYSYGSDTKLKKDLVRLSSNLNHLQVSFNQITYKKLRDKTKDSSGSASFSKPGLFKWQIYNKKGPEIKKSYYYDGKLLAVFSPTENLVTEYSTTAGMAKGLKGVVDMVLRPDLLLKKYDLLKIESISAGKYWANLKPKKTEITDIIELKIMINEKFNYISNISMAYQNGNKIQFEFTDPIFQKIGIQTYKFSGPSTVTRKRAG